MKRSIFLLLSVVMVVGLAASCGGGGDDDGDYNFNGRWLAMFTLVSSSVPGAPGSGPDVLLITQNGGNISLRFESTGDLVIMQGACDPKAKTFAATGMGTGRFAGIRSDINGAGVHDDSMSGTWTISKAGAFAKYDWTADLGSHNLRVSAEAGGGGAAADVLKALSR